MGTVAIICPPGGPSYLEMLVKSQVNPLRARNPPPTSFVSRVLFGGRAGAFARQTWPEVNEDSGEYYRKLPNFLPNFAYFFRLIDFQPKP